MIFHHTTDAAPAILLDGFPNVTGTYMSGGSTASS